MSSFLIHLDGSEERKLVSRDHAFPPFTAQVSIIDFDVANQLFALVTLEHDLQNLVPELPGSVVADFQFSRELQRGEAIFVLHQQINGQRPRNQQKVCATEESASASGQ